MKKIMFLVVMLLVFSSTSVLAVTTGNTNANVQADIDSINSLTTQIQALQAERKSKLSELIIKLRQGTRSDAVIALQTLLSLDPSVYPEGLVTGYFGNLTSAAVKKFQAKNGLEQVGFVGPRTVEKLKKFADDNSLTVEDESAAAGNSGLALGKLKRLCAIIPPGHFIAPGFLKKTGGVRPEVPTCQNLPPGIKAKLDGSQTPTDPNDHTAPVISDVDTDDVTAASVKITWDTDENSNSKVWYSTNNPVVTTGSPNKTDAAMVKEHSITLTGLNDDTTYYFVVGSADANGNLAKSSQGSFETAEEDNTDPDIDNLDESNITTTGAKITWTTDEVTTDKIWYSTTSPVSTAGAANMTDNTLDTTHMFTLTGLTANTQYYYVVESTDSSGNDTVSSEGTFTTLSTDTTDPVISDLDESDITQTGAKVNWTTNEGAKDKIWYSTTDPVSTAGAANAEDNTLDTSHSFTLSGLTAGTVYYYRVSSTDSSGNDTMSAQGTFTTLP